jgi:molybdopterin/thiamine biosynthesis adenylyltransferase
MTTRYDRQLALFGSEGQHLIETAHVAIAGIGGIGMHLVQQLAYLGVRRFTIADDDTVAETNLNRLVGALPCDIDQPKIAIAVRLIEAIQPGANVVAVPEKVPHPDVLDAFTGAAVVVGAFDRETPRLHLTDWCSTVGLPYVDCATEVIPTSTGPVYGGRVVVAGDGDGCLSCLDLIDHNEVAREAMTDAQRVDHDKIYGINRSALDGSGPSVVSINGVIASLAVTEVMCLLTGLRKPVRQTTYHGNQASVRPSADIPRPGCPFCARWGLATAT